MISKMRKARRILDNAEEPKPLAASTVKTYDRITRAAKRTGLGYAGYVRWVTQSAPARLGQTYFAIIRRFKEKLWALRLRCRRAADLAEHTDLVLHINGQLNEIESIKKAQQRSPKGPSRSIRKSLSGKPSNLDVLVARHLTPAALQGGLALILTGARPAEIAKGITFNINKKGLLEAAIIGAKLTEVSGQELRTLTFDTSLNAIAMEMYKLVRANGGPLLVTRKPRRLHKDISRAAKAAGFSDISPYSFRHLFASRRKKEVPPDDGGTREIAIAESLGHRVTKTQSKYGFARQSVGGGSGVVLVSASNGVRLNHDRPDSYKYVGQRQGRQPDRQPSGQGLPSPLDESLSG